MIDVNIVGNVSKQEVESLESLLDDSALERPKDTVTIEVPTNTVVVYTLNLNETRKFFLKKSTLHTEIAGMACILSNDGFLFSANHVFHDSSSGSSSRKITLAYDPHVGLFYRVRVLAYSRDADMLLGKIDDEMPDDYDSIRIATSMDPNNFPLSTYLYRNKKIITDVLEQAIGNSLFFKLTRHGFHFKQKSDIDINPENLEDAVMWGTQMDPSTVEEKIKNLQWKHSFEVLVERGDSGAPVFDIQGRFAGVIIQKGHKEPKHYAVSTGNPALGQMLRNYIDYQKSLYP